MYLLIISRIFDTIPVIDIGRSILISEGCIKNVVKFNCYKNIKKELEKGKSMKKSLPEDIVFDNGIGVNQKRLKPCLENCIKLMQIGVNQPNNILWQIR